jgi:pimeloyl-ACP methyl ester carboxylesterase
MIVVNGIQFHYWTVGQGPDVVLLHGLGGNLAIWHLKVVPLLRQDFRVTTYDLRGHGHSDMPATGYTTADMADDLRGILDGLGIGQAHLVGHSLGADIALHFALRYPERAGKLILVEAGLPAMIGARKDESWIGWTYWAEMLERFTGHRVPPEKRTDWKYLLRQSLNVPILFGPARGHPRKQDKFLKLLETSTLVQDYETVGELTLENIATIPHPKLLIYDQHSPYIETYRALRAVASNCTAVLLPPTDLRHFFPLEEPERLAQHIREFLSPDGSQGGFGSEDGRS